MRPSHYRPGRPAVDPSCQTPACTHERHLRENSPTLPNCVWPCSPSWRWRCRRGEAPPPRASSAAPAPRAPAFRDARGPGGSGWRAPGRCKAGTGAGPNGAVEHHGSQHHVAVKGVQVGGLEDPVPAIGLSLPMSWSSTPASTRSYIGSGGSWRWPPQWSPPRWCASAGLLLPRGGPPCSPDTARSGCGIRDPGRTGPPPRGVGFP